MAYPMVGHEAQAFLDGMGWADLNDLLGKNFFDRRLFGGFAFEGDFAGIVAFGNDADESAMIGDEESADVLFSHHLDGVKNHRFGGDGPNRGAFVIQDLNDFTGGIHGMWILLEREQGGSSSAGAVKTLGSD